MACLGNTVGMSSTQRSASDDYRRFTLSAANSDSEKRPRDMGRESHRSGCPIRIRLADDMEVCFLSLFVFGRLELADRCDHDKAIHKRNSWSDDKVWIKVEEDGVYEYGVAMIPASGRKKEREREKEKGSKRTQSGGVARVKRYGQSNHDYEWASTKPQRCTTGVQLFLLLFRIPSFFRPTASQSSNHNPPPSPQFLGRPVIEEEEDGGVQATTSKPPAKS